MDRPAVWIDVTASDASASRAFYGELFGWRIDVDEQLDYGLVDAGGSLAGGIGQAGDASPHPVGVVTYVPVEDVTAAVARAEEAGGSVLVEPWTLPGLGTMAVVGDPDGNRIGLWAAL
ncbi:VOC family protein [Actinomycetospora termitidis]|uniref:VOC family protein n=1 Tax=Actinomycetospora termitidis TaxID=3053470 RepID=A0ABT7M494_9PSEU|nr:VOC family protein [Actinomycetospora sp. Odt1-22]MDL5155500.1 VOC family protein [Actinomycetospora sp. Odt1-22]